MQGGRCISESIHNQQSVLSTGNVNHSTARWGNLMNPGTQDANKSSSDAQDQVRGHQVANRVPNLSGSASDYCKRDTELGGSNMGRSDGCWHNASPNRYSKEKHERLTYDTSFNDHGASSSSSGYFTGNGNKFGSSLFSSGKRKAPEGDHSQLYAGESSSSHVQAKKDITQNTIPAVSSASGSNTTAPFPMEWSFSGRLEELNLRPRTEKRETYCESSRAQMYVGGSSSSPVPAETVFQHTVSTSQGASPMEWSFTRQPDQQNLRIGIEERETYSEFFPPPNITDIAENIDERPSIEQHDPNSFIFPWTDTALRPFGSSSGNQPSRSFWSTDSSLMRNSCNPSSQSHEFLIPENTESKLPSCQSGSLDPQSGRLLKVLRFSDSRSTAFRDEQSSRISLRNHSDLPASNNTSLSKDLLQGSSAVNLAFGSTRPSESLLPSSRSGYGLSMQNLHTGWTPQNWTRPNQQGLTPQLPFQHHLPDYRMQICHFPVIPPTPSSLTEGVIPSFNIWGRQNQSSRSSLNIHEQTDPTNRQRGLAVDIEARQRLNVSIGVAEMYDQHRDMRLDIDNMSYEELLALGERIGNVSTGFSDKVIMQSMKRRKHLQAGSSSNSEPCCICQEEFVSGDEIGATACEHEFHFNCIKQWLSAKNTCPICKKTALDT